MPREAWYIQRIKKVVRLDMYNRMNAWAKHIFEDALASREYQGFTGNTQTSYSVGIFVDGKLSSVKTPNSEGVETRNPVRRKIPYRHSAFLSHPFEGEARGVYGDVNVDNLYGFQTALKNIKEFKTNEAFAMFITTGTEYSEYLELGKDRLVLYGAMVFTEAQLEEVLKDIPKL